MSPSNTPWYPKQVVEDLLDAKFKPKDGAEGHTLLYHAGNFYVYKEQRYKILHVDQVRSVFYRFLDIADLNKKKADDLLDALKALTMSSSENSTFWRANKGNRPAPGSVLSFSNGLLDLESWIKNPALPVMPHTSDWFSTSVLPYNYDPNATCPKWMETLNQWFNYDASSIRLLAQCMGLMMTSDTSWHKIFYLIGPPRSGKSTVLKILAALVGEDNVASTNFDSLAKDFGLEHLVDKAVALVGDAHLGRKTDSGIVTERLKSISGEDLQVINRKHEKHISIRLGCRIVIASNSFENLEDSSGALSSRLLLIPFMRSFLGNENLNLEAELKAELPGIANWALRGLASLKAHGFEEVHHGKALKDEYLRQANPIVEFWEECLTDRGSSTIDELYQAWKEWSTSKGIYPESAPVLAKRIRAFKPSVKTSRSPRNGKKVTVYNIGITASK